MTQSPIKFHVAGLFAVDNETLFKVCCFEGDLVLVREPAKLC